MIRVARCPRRGLAVSAAALAMAGAIAALSGCQSLPVSRPSVPVPALPPLQLLQSEPLVLADDCVAGGSYFIEFTVMTDGRTGRIRPPAAPPCVQQALTAWVDSFRYAPPATETPGGMEWMLVTAHKGS